MGFKNTLHQVWVNNGSQTARYVPRAVSPPLPNWEVWDRKEQRFLTDRQVRSIDPTERLTVQ